MKTKYSYGWMPDFPDFRDYNETSEKIKPFVEKMGLRKKRKKRNQRVDLRKWCSPIEDQGTIGSCTAQAGVGMIEYFERRSFGKHIEGSKLFLYKATRNLLNFTGDTGAYIRSAMGAMALFGVPEEKYWPYQEENYDHEPPSFCYAFASNYKATHYYRLDYQSLSKKDLLNNIKDHLHAGLPIMFGFSVYNSLYRAENGRIPFPLNTDRHEGGHAVLAVGYDDRIKIKHPDSTVETNGAILIRNSWGTQWGEDGYGWLPYDYVLEGLAEDWWCLIKADYIDTGKFKR